VEVFAALELTKLFGIDDFPAANDSGKVLIIIIYCYLIIIIIIITFMVVIVQCCGNSFFYSIFFNGLTSAPGCSKAG